TSRGTFGHEHLASIDPDRLRIHIGLTDSDLLASERVKRFVNHAHFERSRHDDIGLRTLAQTFRCLNLMASQQVSMTTLRLRDDSAVEDIVAVALQRLGQRRFYCLATACLVRSIEQ